MHTHPNARLTPLSQERLLCRHIDDGEPLPSPNWPLRRGSASAPPTSGSLVTAQAGPTSQAVRRSGRRTQRRTLDPQQLQNVVDLRHQRLHLQHLARLLRAPFSTVARALSRLGLGRLRSLDPNPPVQRDEWERSGDQIHIDVKPLARFRKVGHRFHGDRQQGRSYGVGYDKVHVANDHATTLACVEVLVDEQKLAVIGPLSRTGALFNGQGSRVAQGDERQRSRLVSKSFAKACSRTLRLRHICTAIHAQDHRQS